MRKWNRVQVALGIVALASGAGLAQPPSNDELQRQINELRAEITGVKSERDSLKEKVSALEGRIGTGDQEEVNRRIAELTEVINRRTAFYTVPNRGVTSQLFRAIPGGLIFTGLFRTRIELREHNVDFRGGGADDEGVRLAGRFKLGFGADLLKQGTERILALNEFQTSGTFANNSNFFDTRGNSFESGIFREPFRDLRLYQGFLSFDNVIADNTVVTIGRQEMALGSELVLGNNSFFGGTTQDAVRVKWWIPETFEVTGFYAKEGYQDLRIIGRGIDAFDEDQFMGIFAHGDVLDLDELGELDLEAYALYFDARTAAGGQDVLLTGSGASAFDRAYIPGIVGHFWTLGARAFWSQISLFDGVLAVNAEAAYQTGSNKIASGIPNATIDQSLHGWATEFVANYWMDSAATEGLKPIFTLGYYYAQGGSHDGNGDPFFNPNHVGWQSLFITRHESIWDRDDTTRPYFPGGARYGTMDLVPLNNIHIARAAVSIAPTSSTEVGVGYLLAVTADDIGYGSGLFGHEIDIFGSYWYKKGEQEAKIVFSGNFSFFFPESTAEHASEYYFPVDAGESVALGFFMQAHVEF